MNLPINGNNIKSIYILNGTPHLDIIKLNSKVIESLTFQNVNFYYYQLMELTELLRNHPTLKTLRFINCRSANPSYSDVDDVAFSVLESNNALTTLAYWMYF